MASGGGLMYCLHEISICLYFILNFTICFAWFVFLFFSLVILYCFFFYFEGELTNLTNISLSLLSCAYVMYHDEFCPVLSKVIQFYPILHPLCAILVRFYIVISSTYIFTCIVIVLYLFLNFIYATYYFNTLIQKLSLW